MCSFDSSTSRSPPTPSGSGLHAWRAAGRMLAEIERVLLDERPDWVLVYGDTNSTLAGALAGAKLHIPVAHVEAGLRSFNRRMPEETNRVVTDDISSLLLCPSQVAVSHLAAEGICEGVRRVGDVMGDAFADARRRAARESHIHEELSLTAGNYWLATLHRAENTDDPVRLGAIVSAFDAVGSSEIPVVFAVHPRTRKTLETLGWRHREGVRLIAPLSYLDMVALQVAARGILTDSGGVQKEAYWAGVPCTTLRDETEWTETVESGWNALAGADRDRIVAIALREAPSRERPALYWNENAADAVVAALDQASSRTL